MPDITITADKQIKLLTQGKYCDSDIIIVPEGGVELFAAIGVDYPIGSDLNCTNGVITLEAETDSGQWVFAIPEAGRWTVTSTDKVDPGMTKSETFEIETKGQFEYVKLEYKLTLFAPGVTDKMSIGFGTSVSAGLATVTVSDTVKITSQTNGTVSYMSKDPIDLSNYSIIKSDNVAYSGDGFLVIDTIRDRNYIAQMPVARTTEATLAVDGYTGEYYIGIACFAGGSKEIAGLVVE